MKVRTCRTAFSILNISRLLLGLAILALAGLPGARVAQAANAFVRVNQVGYEVGVQGRAYLMAKVAETGAVYRVLDANGNVKSSTALGATTGTWGDFTIYAMDFKVNDAGKYTIDVHGPANATSLQFTVDTALKLYKSGVANALYFYQNERDGAHFIPTPLRSAAGHLNDSHLNVYASPQFDEDDLIVGTLQPAGLPVDGSGGWWDAGDYIKFVQTHSYTAALMLIGVRDFPKQMGANAGVSNFTAEAKFGVDWLNKMWNDNTQTLYYQVGIGTGFEDNENLFSDHDLWRLPQEDDTFGGTDPNLQYIRSRPVLIAGPAGSKISPNLAGRLAASFAGCYQVLHKTNPSYADKCLLAAEHIFALADTAPTGNLLTVAPFDFYGEGEWRDDLELGAAELYFAEGVRRFIIGLGKKLIIADTVAYAAEQIFSAKYPALLTPGVAWLGVLCYTIQIYFDFSGYSDMAIGMGRMFGFVFPENFNYPYISQSITDFWRRWHITLSSWFRDYLYIPMGGNRVPPWRVYFNLMTVFFLCGLWHGATWSFVVWGMFHGTFLIIERVGLTRWLERVPRVVRHAYALLVVMIGWVFFNARDLSHAITYLQVMFGLAGGSGLEYGVRLYLNNAVVLAIIAGVVGSMPVIPWIRNGWNQGLLRREGAGLMLWELLGRLTGVVMSMGVFLASTMMAAHGSYSPFIYYRF